ncbi:hypothetical protein KKA14_12575, partial [bacterium]|nr:hypothetical protein [bacterium]
LKTVIKHQEVRTFLEKVSEDKSEDSPRTPAELVSEIYNLNVQAGEALKYELANFVPRLILNQVRTPTDVRIGFSMGNASEKHFGVSLEYVGFVEHDNVVLQSIRQRRPVILHSPDSTAASCIVRIGQNIRQNFHLIHTN